MSSRHLRFTCTADLSKDDIKGAIKALNGVVTLAFESAPVAEGGSSNMAPSNEGKLSGFVEFATEEDCTNGAKDLSVISGLTATRPGQESSNGQPTSPNKSQPSGNPQLKRAAKPWKAGFFAAPSPLEQEQMQRQMAEFQSHTRGRFHQQHQQEMPTNMIAHGGAHPTEEEGADGERHRQQHPQRAMRSGGRGRGGSGGVRQRGGGPIYNYAAAQSQMENAFRGEPGKDDGDAGSGRGSGQQTKGPVILSSPFPGFYGGSVQQFHNHIIRAQQRKEQFEQRRQARTQQQQHQGGEEASAAEAQPEPQPAAKSNEERASSSPQEQPQGEEDGSSHHQADTANEGGSNGHPRQRGGRGGYPNRNHHRQHPQNRVVGYVACVDGLPMSVTNDNLFHLLRPLGHIYDISRHNCMALVYFAEKSCVTGAIASLNGSTLDEATVTVADGGFVHVNV